MKGAYLLLANIIYVTCQFLILSFLSKSFSVDKVGEYFLALAISAPIMMFFALKLNAYVITTNDFDVVVQKSKLLFIRLSYTLLGVFTVVSLYLLFFIDDIDLSVLAFVLLIKSLEHLDDFHSAYFSKTLDFKGFSKIKIYRGVGLLASVSVSILLSDSFYVVMILASIIYLMLWLLMNRRFLNKVQSASGSEMKKVFSTMWSMGFSSSAQSLATSGCRTYVGIAISSGALAIYGCISYLLTAVNLVTNALGTYYLPQFTICAESKSKFFKKLFQSQVLVLFLSFLLLVLVDVLGKHVLLLLFNSEVAEYSDGLFILAISACFKASSNLVGTALTSTRKYTLQVWFTLFNLFFITVFLFLYREKGLLGIFEATLAATVLEWLLMVIVSIRYFYEYFKKNLN